MYSLVQIAPNITAATSYKSLIYMFVNILVLCYVETQAFSNSILTNIIFTQGRQHSTGAQHPLAPPHAPPAPHHAHAHALWPHHINGVNRTLKEHRRNGTVWQVCERGAGYRTHSHRCYSNDHDKGTDKKRFLDLTDNKNLPFCLSDTCLCPCP